MASFGKLHRLVLIYTDLNVLVKRKIVRAVFAHKKIVPFYVMF